MAWLMQERLSALARIVPEQPVARHAGPRKVCAQDVRFALQTSSRILVTR